MTPDEQLQMRVRAAERAHDDERDFATAANAAAIKNAQEAIKAVILINGGSSVAMLAFIGTLVSRDFLSPSQMADITKPLMWFASGVGAEMIAAAAAYFTNLGIAGSSSRKMRNYEQPFIASTPSSSPWQVRGSLSLDRSCSGDRFHGLLCGWADYGTIRVQQNIVRSEARCGRSTVEQALIIDGLGFPSSIH